MNIVVCIRYGAYLCSQLGFNPFDNTIRKESVVHKINTCDENAVEEALRIKDKMGENCKVTVVTAGGMKAEEGLRYCMALGTDSAFHVCDSRLENSDPLTTATALFHVIKKINYDLILCGKKAEDTSRGQVGLYLAELLDLPAVSSVVDFKITDNQGKALVRKSLGRGDRVVIESSLPALFTIEKGINNPRYPVVTSRLKVVDRQITRIEFSALDTGGEEILDEQFLPRLTQIALPRKRPRKAVQINVKLSAADRLKAMMSGGGKENKTGDDLVIEENPEKAAEKLVNYLDENGFLPRARQGQRSFRF